MQQYVARKQGKVYFSYVQWRGVIHLLDKALLDCCHVISIKNKATNGLSITSIERGVLCVCVIEREMECVCVCVFVRVFLLGDKCFAKAKDKSKPWPSRIIVYLNQI